MIKPRVGIIGISGASGMPYAFSLIKTLAKECKQLEVVISEGAIRVLKEEHDISFSLTRPKIETLVGEKINNVIFHHPGDYGSPIASGTYLTDFMLIVPCSMSTLAAVATGVSSNLLHRAADVTIKEQRKLIIVPRETPLSAIHLENMLKLAKLGVAIVPPMPGFYQKPKSISDITEQVAMKVLDLLNIASNCSPRWGLSNANNEQEAL